MRCFAGKTGFGKEPSYVLGEERFTCCIACMRLDQARPGCMCNQVGSLPSHAGAHAAERLPG